MAWGRELSMDGQAAGPEHGRGEHERGREYADDDGLAMWSHVRSWQPMRFRKHRVGTLKG
jgi:hypothetical protein